MKKNIGTKDRMIRLSFGILLLGLSIWYHSWVLLGLAVFTFYEALASWCVWYQIIGKNTCPISSGKSKK